MAEVTQQHLQRNFIGIYRQTQYYWMRTGDVSDELEQIKNTIMRCNCFHLQCSRHVPVSLMEAFPPWERNDSSSSRNQLQSQCLYYVGFRLGQVLFQDLKLGSPEVISLYRFPIHRLFKSQRKTSFARWMESRESCSKPRKQSNYATRDRNVKSGDQKNRGCLSLQHLCKISLHLIMHLPWPTQEKFLIVCPSVHLSISMLLLLPRWRWW